MATISPVFTTLFHNEVKHAYQASMMLRGTVRTKMANGSEVVKFPKLSAGVAMPRTAPASDVIPMGLTYSPATVTMTDWNASEYSDIFNQAKINFEDRSELVKAIANAMGRRYDQLIVDALVAATPTIQVTNDTGGTDSDMNIAKLLEVKRKMDAANIPPTGRHWLGHSNALAALLTTTQVTSSDYASVKALVKGEVDTFLGFQFHWMGDRAEGGLPKATNTRTNFAWHEDSVGIAIGLDIRSTIDWVPTKRSWLVSSDFSGNGVVIDEAGVAEIATEEP
jgi:hypothetical protein